MSSIDDEFLIQMLRNIYFRFKYKEDLEFYKKIRYIYVETRPI